MNSPTRVSSSHRRNVKKTRFPTSLIGFNILIQSNFFFEKCLVNSTKDVFAEICYFHGNAQAHSKIFAENKWTRKLESLQTFTVFFAQQKRFIPRYSRTRFILEMVIYAVQCKTPSEHWWCHSSSQWNQSKENEKFHSFQHQCRIDVVLLDTS